MEPPSPDPLPTPATNRKYPGPHLPTWPARSDSESMSGPAWPGTLVPFPLSANTVSGKLGRLTTPPQRPIGHSQESHLGRELTVENQLGITTVSTYTALGAWNSYLPCHNESLKALRQEVHH